MNDNPLKYSLTTRFKERQILRLLELKPGERLLDVGCGIGYLSGLGAAAGTRVYGVDLSRQALRYARGSVRGQFAVASALDLPFADNSFDKVIFADVIEHLPDDRQALEEIARVARPGARLVVSTPALEGAFTRTWLKTFMHGPEDQFQKNYREGYTTDSLRQLMGDCRIGDTRTAYTNFLVTEIFLGLTKAFYATRKRYYRSQADLVEVSSSWLFSLYRAVVFPVFLWLGRLEEWVVRKWMKGHCLIVCGTIDKSGAP